MINNIYVINLETSTERWKQFKKQQYKLPTIITRVNAVNGNLLNKPSFLTPGVIGCFLSHKKVLQMIVDNKDDYAIICEDDAIFSKNFNKQITKILSDLKTLDWDLVYLGCYGAWHPYKTYGPVGTVSNLLLKLRVKSHTKIKETKHLITPDTPLGSHCYLVNYKSAKKILTYLTHYEGYDQALLRHLHKLNSFVSKKRIAFQQSTSQNSTLSVNFPQSLNYFIKNFKEDGNSYDFYLSAPLGQCQGVIINTWLIIFFLSLLILPKKLILSFLTLELIYGGFSSQLLYWFLFHKILNHYS